MRIATWTSVIALAAVAQGLAACGGGGGGAAGGSMGGGGGGAVVSRIGLATVTPRSGSADTDAETARNWGLAAIGGDMAQAAGKTGAGVTVGVIDTGIDLHHPDFTGAISADSTDIVSGSASLVDDLGGHGTAVAGIIGARRDGFDMVGVAPDSTLLAVRADATGSCDNKCFFYNSDLANATDYAVSKGASILNYSLGGGSLSSNFQTALSNAVGAGRIIVAAAGNEGGAQPLNPAAWLAGGDANGLGIAVGAVDSTNTLAGFSNRAGAAMNYFLVAPGVDVTTTRNGGGVTTVNGTSFAAPHVAGAAALVWGASPFLTGQQVVNILLDSATDLGDPGTDSIYGRGMVNVNAALAPLGGTSIPTGATVADGGSAPQATGLTLGGAFGPASFSAPDAIFLDAYGRPFTTDLGQAVSPRPLSSPLSGWLDQSGETVTASPGPGLGLSLSRPTPEPVQAPHLLPGTPAEQPRMAMTAALGADRIAVARGYGLGSLTGLAAAAPQASGQGLSGDWAAQPYLGLGGSDLGLAAGRELGNGLALTAGLSHGEGDQRAAMLVEGSRRFANGAVLGAQAGVLNEEDGPLASAGSGALALNGAETSFTGLFGALPLQDGFSLFGRYGWGVTDSRALEGGLWQGGDDLRSENFALGASLNNSRGRWSLTVSRPLRVVDGSALLAVPVGRTMDGHILYRTQEVQLSPTGAETDLEISWSAPLASGQRLVLGGMAAFQPGHDAQARPAYTIGAKYRLRW